VPPKVGHLSEGKEGASNLWISKEAAIYARAPGEGLQQYNHMVSAIECAAEAGQPCCKGLVVLYLIS
jgi:hypothetical protein